MKIFFAGVLTALILAGGVYLLFIRRPESASTKPPAAAATPVSLPSRQEIERLQEATTRTNAPGVPLIPNPIGSPTVAEFHVGPVNAADRSIEVLAKQHPEFGLSPRAIQALQTRYSQLTAERAVLEVRLATITPVGPKKNAIKIPAYFDQGKNLLDRLEKEVKAQLSEPKGTEFMKLAAAAFLADNHDLGRQPQELTVEKTDQAAFNYEIVRTVQVIDPTTKKVIGTGRTVENLPAGAFGAYEQQSQFFPK